MPSCQRRKDRPDINRGTILTKWQQNYTFLRKTFKTFYYILFFSCFFQIIQAFFKESSSYERLEKHGNGLFLLCVIWSLDSTFFSLRVLSFALRRYVQYL